MADEIRKPIATSIRVDHEHTLEMRADMATKTAEVENVTTGEMYTSGGGDSDFSTAEVTITANAGEGSFILSGGIDGLSEGCGFLTANDFIRTLAGADAGTTITHQAILIKGHAVYEPVNGTIISVTGGITYDSDENVLIVTGDGTITADPTAQ